MTNETMIPFIIITLFISLMGSVLLLWIVKKNKQKNETGKATQSKNTVCIFLIVFGLLFILFGTFNITYMQNQTKDWIKIPAVIDGVSRYKGNKIALVTVNYEYNQEVYELIPLDFKSSSMAKGQQVMIVVNPKQPEQIRMDLRTSSIIDYVLIAVGALIFSFSLYFYIRKRLGKSAKVRQAAVPLELSDEENSGNFQN